MFYQISGISRISGDIGVVSEISGVTSEVSRIVSGIVLNFINRTISYYELRISFTKK